MESTKPSSSPPTSSLLVREATLNDLSILDTIFFHAFHPTSPFMRKAIPNTPTVVQWWREAHMQAINDPAIRLMLVVDPNANDRIVAFARWQLPERKDKSGFWSKLSKDHDEELCSAMIGPMMEYREKLLEHRRHYSSCADKPFGTVIELLGTIHEYKGRGAGKMLIQQCCDEADTHGCETYVEANHSAMPLYQKFGFEKKAEKKMPGEIEYMEYFLVRQPRKTQLQYE